MWHQVDGRWNAEAAERMYSGPLRAALKKTYPQVRGKFRVMEDNDPTGYKSRKGMAAPCRTRPVDSRRARSVDFRCARSRVADATSCAICTIDPPAQVWPRGAIGRGPTAEAAKKAAGISTLDLPKRSPDLMPLDFSFWKNLNTRMRAQEKDWPDSKKETRAQYLARLRRTALATPADFINSIMGAMHKRCKLCDDAKGGHFPEGGGI